MKLPITVTFIDGSTEDVVAVFADFIAFERAWSRSVQSLQGSMRLTDLAYLAWSNLSRSKKTTLKFDPEWIATVEMVQVSDDEVAVDNPLEKSQQPT